MNPIKQLMEKVSRVRGAYQSICLIGDSISDHYYVSAEDKHWFSMLRNSVNQQQGSGDFETITNFFDAGVPTFTLGGSTSAGTGGPLSNSLVLSANAYIEFYGDFKYVDAWVHRTSSAGSLAFAYNGTTYKTVNCAGTETPDVHTTEIAGYVAATAGNGTHRIKAIGGPVEITALQRLRGDYAVAQQIRFTRIARQGMTPMQYLGGSTLASIKKIGCAAEPTKNATQQALFIVALGTNNIYNATNYTTPAAYQQHLMLLFALLKDAGAIVFLSPFQGTAGMPSGEPFLEYLAAAKTACESMRVPFVELNAHDFIGSGYMHDTIHPNDDGNAKIFEIVVEALAERAIEGPTVGSSREIGPYTYAFDRGSSYGVAIGAFWLGSNWVAVKPEAKITELGAGVLREYYNTGLTAGGSFEPTSL